MPLTFFFFFFFCVITNWRLGLRAPLVVRNKQTSKCLRIINLLGSICTGFRLFRNNNLLTAHEHVANSYIVPSLYIYSFSFAKNSYEESKPGNEKRKREVQLESKPRKNVNIPIAISTWLGTPFNKRI